MFPTRSRVRPGSTAPTRAYDPPGPPAEATTDGAQGAEPGPEPEPGVVETGQAAPAAPAEPGPADATAEQLTELARRLVEMGREASAPDLVEFARLLAAGVSPTMGQQ